MVSLDLIGTELTWPEGAPMSEFGYALGPMMAGMVDGARVFGVETRRAHGNESGMVHGGALTGLVDEAIGTIVAHATGRRHVTIQFGVAFVAAVHVGDFVVPRCRIVGTSGSITSVTATLTVGTVVVLTASLTFKAVRTT